MPKYEIMPSTSAEDVLARFTHACAGESIDFHRERKTQNAMEMAEAITKETWVLWHLFNLGEITHPDVRRVLVAKVSTPLRAYIFYHAVDWLTTEEKTILEEKFAGLDADARKMADEIIERRSNK